MRKLKVYLASRWEDRDEIITFRNYLIKTAGIECTARWLTPYHPRLKDKVANDRKTAHTVQKRDMDDILSSDLVIVFSPRKAHGNGTGGRHVECGIALGAGIPVLLCGIPENVFHCNDDVTTVPTVKKLVQHLKRLTKTKNKKIMKKYGTKLVHTDFYYDGYDHGIPPRR